MRKAFLLVSLLAIAGIGFGLKGFSKSAPVHVAKQAVDLAEEEEQDGAEEALKWRMLGWRDQNGNIPKDGLLKARAQRLANLDFWKGNGVRPATTTWLSVGPSDVAGRTLGLAIDPRNELKMFAATAGGGLWRTTDGGANWQIVDDRWKSLAVGYVAMDPSNPDILYAGTGEGNHNGDAVEGAGIYKSVDGGNTWFHLSSTISYRHVNSISVNPANGQYILAGTRTAGVIRSTDGGITWTTFLGGDCQDVHFSTADPNRAVCYVKPSAYYSTDAGASWTVATGPSNFDRISLHYAKSNNSIVYALTGAGLVYRSTDGGQTYAGRGSVTVLGSQGWYDCSIWVDPTNPDILVVGGVDGTRSTDGGVTWTTISYWPFGNPHADHHLYVGSPSFDGVTNKTVYFCTDGGVFKTTDIYNVSTGSGWTGLNKGQASTQYYGAFGDGPTGKIVGGLQDNGTLVSTTSSTTSTAIFGGDGGFCALDPTDPNYAYGEYVYLQIHRSTGFGSSYIKTGLTDAGTAANFIAPFILSPSDPNVMWGGGARLWRSTNVKAATPSWTNVKATNGSNISAIAEAPSNKNIVWVGMNNGTIQATSNALDPTPTWTTIDNNSGTNPLPNRFCARILIDPSNSAIVYVSFGGFNTDNLWRTTDSGASWIQITGSGATALPAAPIRGLARHPLDPNYIFAGTEVGVFASTDGGATWSASDFGPANVAVYELNFMNNTTNVLLATTHGRGLWATTVGGSVALANMTVPSKTVVGGNVLTGKVTLTSEAPVGGTVVTLASDSSNATVQPSVTVKAGFNTANFAIATKGVDTASAAKITASVSGFAVSQDILINKATFKDIVLSPSTVEGGVKTTAIVHLDGATGPSGLTMSPYSGGPVASVPASVSFGANVASKSFSVSTNGVDSNTTTTIGVTFGPGASQSTTLTVVPTTMQSVTSSSPSVLGGKNIAVTVTVNGRTGPAGATVFLTESPGVFTLPSAVNLPANAHSVAFTATSKPVSVQTQSTITGTLGVSKSGYVDVLPAAVQSLTLTPTSLVGGVAGKGVVRLTGPAGPAGNAVLLLSDPLLVQIPTTVTVPAGATAVSFNIGTKGVNATTFGLIDASGIIGSTVSASLQLTPATMSSVTLVPTSVKGGTNASCVVRIVGLAGPAGTVVTLSSSSAKALVPASVTIPPGKSAVSFTVKTTAVASNTTANITGTANSTSAFGVLTITP